MRKVFGYCAVIGTMIVSALIWRGLKQETEMRNARDEALTEGQDLIYAYICLINDCCPVVVINSQGKITQWNKAMERLTGIDSDHAKKEGLQSIMCDAAKIQQHNDGVKLAFSDTDKYEKLTVVHCNIWDAKRQRTPVRVSVRIVRDIKNSDEILGVARVDKEVNVEEYGKPPTPPVPLKSEK